MTDPDSLPAPRPMPAPARQATAQMLSAVVTAQATKTERRWWPRGVVAGVTAAAVLTGGAAGAYVAFAPATDQVIVRCFTLPDPGDDDDFYGTDLIMGRESWPGDAPVTDPVLITDPVAACADPWRQGLLTYGVKTPFVEELSPTDLPVPELTACVLESGIAGVFPADAGICARLGLPTLAR